MTLLAQECAVEAEGLWKRYCSSLRPGMYHALRDSARAALGLSRSDELRQDEFWSLRDVTFRVARGEGLALVGRNGAGKTTLVKLLSGVLAPDRGRAVVRGRVASLLMVGAGFHPMLTGRENLYVYGSLLGMRRREITARLGPIVEFSGLEGGSLDTPVKYYSSGMYLRLAFSVAAHTEPEVLIIDEALAVGDAEFRERCMRRLLELKGRGCALVVVSHAPSYLRRLADNAIWLQQGAVVEHGPVNDVLAAYGREVAQRLTDPPAPATVAPVVAAPTEPAARTKAPVISTPVVPPLPAVDPTFELSDLTLDGRTVTDLRLTARREHELRAAFVVGALGSPRELELVLRLERLDGGSATSSSLFLDGRTLWALDPEGRGTLGMRLRADVPGGDYALVLERAVAGRAAVGARRWACRIEEGGERNRREGADERRPCVPLAPVDLQASGVVTRSTSGAPAGAGLQLLALELDGGGDLVHLVGSVRLSTRPQPKTRPLTVLLMGERCVARVRVLAGEPLTHCAIELALRRRDEAARLAATRLDAPELDRLAGEGVATISFAVNLAPGEYVLDCVASGRDRDGRLVRTAWDDASSCVVIGPRPGFGACRFSEQLRGVASVVLPPRSAPSPERRGIVLEQLASKSREACWGELGRIVEVALDGQTSGRIDIWDPGPAALQLTASFDDALRPAFKVTWNASSSSCGGLALPSTGGDLDPVAAGSTRRYDVMFEPSLAPGVYDVNVALQLRPEGEGDPLVIDGRWGAFRWAIAARGVPSGPGRLDARLLIDPAPPP